MDIIESEGGEAVVLDLVDFFLYGMHSKEFNYQVISPVRISTMMMNKAAIAVIEHIQEAYRERLCEESNRFHSAYRI